MKHILPIALLAATLSSTSFAAPVQPSTACMSSLSALLACVLYNGVVIDAKTGMSKSGAYNQDPAQVGPFWTAIETAAHTLARQTPIRGVASGTVSAHSVTPSSGAGQWAALIAAQLEDYNQCRTVVGAETLNTLAKLGASIPPSLVLSITSTLPDCDAEQEAMWDSIYPYGIVQDRDAMGY